MNIERSKKYVEEFNASKVSALVLAAEVPGLIAEIEMLRAQLVGMTGERDSERVIAQEWEVKLDDFLDRYDMLTTAYNEEVGRVIKLQEQLRFIVHACEDSNLPGDPRTEAIADVARKALCL